MTAQPYSPDKYAAAIAMLERRITETAIAAAPTLGLLPAAIITAVHCDIYLHFGPIASPLVGAGVEAVSIAIVATRVLLSGKGLAHREKDMDRAFIGYLFALATVNLGLNIFNLPNTSASWGQGLAELALGLLAIPVAWLVATRHEIAVADMKVEMAKSDAVVLRVENDAKDALIRAEIRQHELDLIAAKGAEKRANQLAQAEKQVAQVASSASQVAAPAPQVATTQKHGRIDLAVLASMLATDPTLTNVALGTHFNVTDEAVRLARKNKLNGI